MARYADDLVVVCEREMDARRVLEVLPKRFGKYGLTLHPEKTRLVRFGRPKDDDDPPESFDFLGFTHHWAKSRAGKWVVKKKTASSRLSRALKGVREWMSRHYHDKVAEQHRSLCRKVQGHYAYYGITGNARALGNFLCEVGRAWRKWLGRRSQRAGLSWERFARLLARYPLPPVRIIHSVYRNAASP